MDFNTRRRYYNRCRPDEPLTPDDERNVDIDGFGVRGQRWVDGLASRIELSDKPVFQLFTGLPGSGKSTELRRLAQRLQRRDGAHLLPVLVDAETSVDLANPVDIPEILASILLCTEKEVLQVEGRGVEDALQEGYLSRLWNWLTTTDVELQKAEFAVPAAGKLVVELKTRPTLRQRVRETIAAHLTKFLTDVGTELKALERRACDQGYRGLIVIFDSLEKLRGVSTNWNEVLNSAERMFAAGAPYLRLPVHVLYTIPTALVLRRVEQVMFLPMIELHDRERKPFEPGMQAARELVRLRVPDDVLEQLLGEHFEKRIRELIEWSGGYPRELVRLLQAAFAVATQPVPEHDLKRIINELKDAYRRTVPAEAFAWLARVELERYLTIKDDSHRPAADLMLSNNAVLRYLNDDEWYELHPAVRDIPGVVEEREKLRAAQHPAAANG
jgi:hypothetical protein